MNWVIRLGHWWENRRVLRKPDLNLLKELIDYTEVHRAQDYDKLQKEWAVVIGEYSRRIDDLEKEKTLPTSTANQLKMISHRLDQLELYVGLKREPVAVKIGAKIS